MARKIALNLDHEFAVPIKVGNKSIVTLKDAALLVQSQTAAVQKRPEWQFLWGQIARAADDRGWMPFAEIALLRALNGVPPNETSKPVAKQPAQGGKDPVASGWQSRRRKRDPWRD